MPPFFLSPALFEHKLPGERMAFQGAPGHGTASSVRGQKVSQLQTGERNRRTCAASTVLSPWSHCEIRGCQAQRNLSDSPRQSDAG